MILGIGVDLVSINRFTQWTTFSDQKLSRIFHPHEIEQLKTEEQKNSFLASRFAVKEAVFKALTAAWYRLHVPAKTSFLGIAPTISIKKAISGQPLVIIDAPWWDQLADQGVSIHLSLSHEKEHALAYVIIEQENHP